MNTNKELYTTVAFKEWVYRENLLPEERYLIETYLDLDRKTVEAGTAGGTNHHRDAENGLSIAVWL